MSHGKVITKDKVNIPDWVTTNSYLVNDFVINDNKFYRANGAIPANTALNTGTDATEWTEMSPSTGEVIKPWLIMTSPAYSIPNETVHILEFQTIWDNVGFTVDTSDQSISLDAAHDHYPYVTFTLDLTISGNGTSNRQLLVYIAYRDSDDDDFTYDWRNGRAHYGMAHTDIRNFSALLVIRDIVNVPGRKFYVVYRGSGFDDTYVLSAVNVVHDLLTSPTDDTLVSQRAIPGGVHFEAHY